MEIRPAIRGDEEGVVRVIRSVFDEYGFTWEPEGYHADLYDLEAYYGGDAAGFWVLESSGVIHGTVALHFFPPSDLLFDGVLDRLPGCDCDLERLYLSADNRGRGWGDALFLRSIAEARARGCQQMEIWSDKRFSQAHKLYQKHGARLMRDRVLHTDPDKSEEWGLVLPLGSVTSCEPGSVDPARTT